MAVRASFRRLFSRNEPFSALVPAPLHRPASCRRALQARASGGEVMPPEQLLEVAVAAAQAGAKVILQAVDKPRRIERKEGVDVVTETDTASEAAVIKAIMDNLPLSALPHHAILGEEGGVIGDATGDYLWVIDPLDGTANFASTYSSFNVSVGVLRHALPVAGCVIEFTGGPGGWTPRTYTASRNGGAFCDGRRITVSGTRELQDTLVATELVWYGEGWSEWAWPIQARLYKEITQRCRGVRMCGAAASNLCHLAQGSVDVYFQYNLKPWDVAAGVLIVEEAGGRVTTADGLAYSVFDRSLLATNDALYDRMLAMMEPATEEMQAAGLQLGPAHVPPGYRVRSGPQLE